MSSILADQWERPRIEAQMLGRGGVAGSQLMSTAVHRKPNKLRRSNSIFNLCLYRCVIFVVFYFSHITGGTEPVRLIAVSLWNKLGVVSPSHHLQCVTLLHRLLELAPQASEVDVHFCQGCRTVPVFIICGSGLSISTMFWARILRV